jgi:acyl-CoA thioesterase-1
VNPLILYFVSGESFYPGAALLTLMTVVSPSLASPRLRRARNVLAWVSLLLIVMACPPFPWFAYAGLALSFVVWYSISNFRAVGTSTRRMCSVPLVGLLVGMTISELPHRTLPVITGPTDDHLVVIGDSISAGLDPRVPPWPIIFEQKTGVPVRNLSKVGATTLEGIELTSGIRVNDHVVLIEVGGNDLIADLPSATFNTRLETMLGKVSAPTRTVLMFELPLLPHKIGYGQIQRRLARKYGVWLIPRRYLVSVIQSADATSDGLHLTVPGTRRMADFVAKALSPVLIHEKS